MKSETELFEYISGTRLMERWGVDSVEPEQLKIQAYFAQKNVFGCKYETRSIKDFLMIITDLGDLLSNLPMKLKLKGFGASFHGTEIR